MSPAKRGFFLSAAVLMVCCGSKESVFSAPLSLRQNNSVTVDAGNSLEEILEPARTRPACGNYWSMLDDADAPRPVVDPSYLREQEILCGKWMFLSWETSGKLPLPEILFNAIERSWPERVGTGFEKLGFLPNPVDPARRPLGIARSTTRYTGMPSVNVTCAACHVGKLPDGRYAIGAPNTKLDLSTFNLMSYYPLYAAMLDADRQKLPQPAQAFFAELERTERRRVVDGNNRIDWSNLVFKYSKMLHMLNIGPKGLPDVKFVAMPPDRDLLSWLNGRPGVFNPGAPMLTIQREGVPNLSIPQIWGITGHEEDFVAGRVAPLGQTTKYASLEKFVASALVYAYQDLNLVRPRNVRPLVAFMRQLQAPQQQQSVSPKLIETGQGIFNSACAQCHDGAAGESTRLFAAETVGSPKALENARQGYKATTPIAKLIDDLSLQLAADLKPQPEGIRSRRLTGIWTRRDLMIDGSVENLDDLFCKSRAGRKFEGSPHGDLCTNFDDSEKEALMGYLGTL
ncbi:MAG: hypothetical protein RI953_436 [Pseudomonadota bacterium]|jgi:cytochrome c5